MIRIALQLMRGDTHELLLEVARDGQPVDLTAGEVWFTVKRRASDPDAAALIQKTVGSGVTITHPTEGKATVVLDPEDTAALPVKQLLHYDVQVREATGQVSTPVVGTLVLLTDITHST